MDLEFLGLHQSVIGLNIVVRKESFVYPSPVQVAISLFSLSSTQPDLTFTLVMVVVTVGEEPLDVMRCTTTKILSMSMENRGVETEPVYPMLSKMTFRLLQLQLSKEK